MGRRRRRYNDYGFAPYVPVAERRAQAKNEVDKLRKKGKTIDPVEIEGRLIARNFWGKQWCKHLESFGDYSNRLPRGRTYVRNGSVCHLGIKKGKVDAMVSGSSMYKVTVGISPLASSKWKSLKKACTGSIGSLIELLQGKLSDEIMGKVTDANKGLFPLPGEIKYKCNCPDWADMCKHIAAVMYGIGARLDSQPELLFLLRGVDHHDLITAAAATDVIEGASKKRKSKRRVLQGSEIENVFGMELDESADDSIATPMRRSAKRKAKKVSPKTHSAKKRKRAIPFKPTARAITKLRKQLKISKVDFACKIGVTPATVTNWENAKGPVKPQAKGLKGLKRLYASCQKK